MVQPSSSGHMSGISATQPPGSSEYGVALQVKDFAALESAVGGLAGSPAQRRTLGAAARRLSCPASAMTHAADVSVSRLAARAQGGVTEQQLNCHPERSEGSGLCPPDPSLAQDDKNAWLVSMSHVTSRRALARNKRRRCLWWIRISSAARRQSGGSKVSTAHRRRR